MVYSVCRKIEDNNICNTEIETEKCIINFLENLTIQFDVADNKRRLEYLCYPYPTNYFYLLS